MKVYADSQQNNKKWLFYSLKWAILFEVRQKLMFLR